VLGPGGRGGAEHFGLLGEVDVVMGTFSKSFASIGGFVAADKRTIDYLRHTARSHIFSASLPPASVASARAALEIIKNEPERRERVIRNAAFMASRLRALGYDAPFHHTAVVPVRCNNDALTMGAFKRLLEKGVFVNPVLEPAVPKGSEMLRTSYMATHTQAMLERALKVFAEVRTPSFPPRVSVRARTLPAWKVRPMVFLPVADRHSLARYYATGDPDAVLRVPGFTRLEIGQPVDFGISFGAEGFILQSQGLVAAKSFSDVGGRPAGIEVQLLPAQSPARDLIERLMDDGFVEPLPARRQTWRYHAGIEVEYEIGGAVCGGIIDDISVGGASVLAEPCPALGTRLPILLKAPPLASIEVTAQVRWQRDGRQPGFGVTFVLENSEQRERINELVDRIRSTSAEIRPASLSVQ
jgi:hypothetical protein